MIQRSFAGLKFFPRRFRRHVYLRDQSIEVMRDILQSRYLHSNVVHKQLARTPLNMPVLPHNAFNGHGGQAVLKNGEQKLCVFDRVFGGSKKLFTLLLLFRWQSPFTSAESTPSQNNKRGKLPVPASENSR